MIKETPTSPPKHYETERMAFAAFLVATGKSQIVSVRPTGNGRQVVFILSDPPSSSVINGFFCGRAKVSALDFSNALATLKSLTYEAHKAAV